MSRSGLQNGGAAERQPGSNRDGGGGAVRGALAYACGSHTPRNRLPILRWLPVYSWSFFVHDLVAGLTVGLTAIPQGIAYAVVAGLEPQVTLTWSPELLYTLCGLSNAASPNRQAAE